MDAPQRILYVEDDTDIQAIAKIALEMIGGFTIQICSSGAEALQVAADFAPDMILLDVMMPGMDGPTTLKKMREQSALVDVPAAFMTAKVQPQEIEEYLAMGAKAVIPKPFDPMTLAQQVRDIYAK